MNNILKIKNEMEKRKIKALVIDFDEKFYNNFSFFKNITENLNEFSTIYLECDFYKYENFFGKVLNEEEKNKITFRNIENNNFTNYKDEFHISINTLMG